MPGQVRSFAWEDATPGLSSDRHSVRVSAESINAYAAATGDGRYRDGARPGQPAPPGYIFVAAPQRRHALMAAIGLRAPEQDPEQARSTPYVGSDVRFHRPVRPGDSVHSVTVLDRKFERGGNRFIVFRVEASDDSGRAIAEYDYTCLWERRASAPGRVGRRTAATGDAGAGVASGPVLVREETEETIAAYGRLPVDRPADWLSTHTDEDFARRAIFGGAVNAGVATVAYTVQWLEMVEEPGALWHGGTLASRALAPVRAGDTLRIGGARSGEQAADGARRYEMTAVNQAGEPAFRTVAALKAR